MGLDRHGIKGALAAILAIVLAAPLCAHAQSVLRVVPQADLKILDTVQTTNNITSNHGYMIYDTLFSLDSKLMPKPQMVESYTRSPDGLNWTFKLRPGLKFHDGQPVTSKDVVASILRFSKRIPAGVTMMQFTKEIVATGPTPSRFVSTSRSDWCSKRWRVRRTRCSSRAKPTPSSIRTPR